MKWLSYNPPSRHPEFGLLHLVRLRAKSVGLSSLLSVAGSPIVDTRLIKRWNWAYQTHRYPLPSTSVVVRPWPTRPDHMTLWPAEWKYHKILKRTNTSRIWKLTRIDSFRQKDFFDPTVTFQNKIQIGCSLVLYPMHLLTHHLLKISTES